MEHIGYSLIDEAGEELQFWGDISGQTQGLPDFVRWPSSDQTHCPALGQTNNGARIVLRQLNQIVGTPASQSIACDGAQIIVTRITPPISVQISKSTIIDRLYAAGKLSDAYAAFGSLDLYTQQRWNSRVSVNSDDPDTILLLESIGADPDVILAAGS